MNATAIFERTMESLGIKRLPPATATITADFFITHTLEAGSDLLDLGRTIFNLKLRRIAIFFLTAFFLYYFYMKLKNSGV
ncbi:hypothetical protein ACFS07_15790 [Undibacterium arcticum]